MGKQPFIKSLCARYWPVLSISFFALLLYRVALCSWLTLLQSVNDDTIFQKTVYSTSPKLARGQLSLCSWKWMVKPIMTWLTAMTCPKGGYCLGTPGGVDNSADSWWPIQKLLSIKKESRMNEWNKVKNPSTPLTKANRLWNFCWKTLPKCLGTFAGRVGRYLAINSHIMTTEVFFLSEHLRVHTRMLSCSSRFKEARWQNAKTSSHIK